jgi:hypothetical protein
VRWRAGDRLLTTREGPISAGIRWWLNAEYSHVVPVLNDRGEVLDVRWPKAKIKHASEYLADRYRILHLRPVEPLTLIQSASWEAAGRGLVGTKYDALSYLGFVTNRQEIEDPERTNCAEACLIMDHSAGILPGRRLALISPQSYMEFLAAGVFEVVQRD